MNRLFMLLTYVYVKGSGIIKCISQFRDGFRKLHAYTAKHM